MCVCVWGGDIEGRGPFSQRPPPAHQEGAGGKGGAGAELCRLIDGLTDRLTARVYLQHVAGELSLAS